MKKMIFILCLVVSTTYSQNLKDVKITDGLSQPLVSDDNGVSFQYTVLTDFGFNVRNTESFVKVNDLDLA